jgi:hypothetical protein
MIEDVLDLPQGFLAAFPPPGGETDNTMKGFIKGVLERLGGRGGAS